MFFTRPSHVHMTAPDHVHMAEKPDVRPSPFIPKVYEQVTPESTPWEYHVLTVDTRETPLPDPVALNALGKEGWILVSILDEKTSTKGSLVHYYFVRKAEE